MNDGFPPLQILCSMNVITLRVVTGKTMLRIDFFFFFLENDFRHTSENTSVIPFL